MATPRRKNTRAVTSYSCELGLFFEDLKYPRVFPDQSCSALVAIWSASLVRGARGRLVLDTLETGRAAASTAAILKLILKHACVLSPRR
jgi:hypothetical protein